MIKVMRFGITWKILSAVFITALVVVCGMLFLVQWSFDRGFLEYVNRIEQETQQNFIATLAKEYETYGNWEFATDDHRYWRELYLRSFLRSGVDISRSGSNDTVRQHIRGRRGRLAGELFKSRMVLLNENKQVLVGRNRRHKQNPGNSMHNDKTSYLPVTVNDRTVGFLAVTPRVALSDMHDLRFSSHLERMFIFIAALMLIVSLALALPLARRLVRPVKELTLATRDPREVVARVKAVLRRTGTADIFPGDDISIDESKYRIRIREKSLDTTVVEFQLFRILASAPGQVWSRGQLMDKIYPDHRIVSERTINSHIKKLRKKIAGILPQREVIHSVYGAGYKFEVGL